MDDCTPGRRRARLRWAGLGALLALLAAWPAVSPAAAPRRVLAFATTVDDAAHVSFVAEAAQALPAIAREQGLDYEVTRDWTRLNATELATCAVVVFLDSRPDAPEARAAFRAYMERGGGWLGFHFAAFALTPSKYPQDWPWYHDKFLGAGQYVSNTWRPTAAVLRVDAPDHPVTRGLPTTWRSAPNEWYRWEHDLRRNPAIRVLLSIDPASFPLGTGPKPHEIWHSGDYPVVWINQKYRMIYLNMGHNDIDYEGKTNKELSSTFASEPQNKLVLNSLLWLGGRGQTEGGKK